MNVLKILGIGYLLGCISPAAILGKLKNVNLKKEGTGNLGATNTAFVLGRRSGIFVLVTDILKSVLSAKISCALFPNLLYAGMIACIGCILGHCFPAFMQFQGGKGVAVFAGMVVMYNPWYAIPIVIIGSALIMILNTGVAAPIFACLLFPVLVAWHSADRVEIWLAAIASIVLIITHRENLKKAFARKEDISVKDFLKKMVS